MKFYSALMVLFIFNLKSLAFASAQNLKMSIGSEDTWTLTDQDSKELKDCFKSRKCTSKQTKKICPWALSQESSGMTDFTEDQAIELRSVCSQCRQLAIITCGYDFDAAQSRFDIFNQVFLSDANKNKPLIFEFSNPNFKFSNLSINDNLAKIEADRATYQAEYDKLLSDLKKLSDNVATETTVISNIKSAHTLIGNFQKKWVLYFKSIDKLKDLFNRSHSLLIDWKLRLLGMTADPNCSGFAPQLILAQTDISALEAAFKKANDVINKSNVSNKLDTISAFTELAIKTKYINVTKTKIEDLERSIGSVLNLDSDYSKANLWWYNTSVGGLASGLHTRYYQYREPLRILKMAAGKGQEFIDTLKINSSAPSAALNRAISSQQQRIKLITDDITWLQSRGWTGQFIDQKLTANSWLSAAKSSVCKQALNVFIEGSAKVKDDIRDYEAFAEPQFLDAMKVCEVAE